MKKLYKSSENKVWAGIIGGIGEYLNADPVILRVIWVFVTIFTGVIPGLVIYIASCFIIPNKTRLAA
jgi:phage shock protein C